MKRLIAIVAAALISAALFGCGESADSVLNDSKIEPSQSVIQKYPGLTGKYYADGKTKESAREKLITTVVPKILSEEITEDDDIELNKLEIDSYELKSFDNGDVANTKINVILNNGDPMERTVLVFITSQPRGSGYRSYFLSYHNMDQDDDIDSETMLSMLNKSLSQTEIETE